MSFPLWFKRMLNRKQKESVKVIGFVEEYEIFGLKTQEELDNYKNVPLLFGYNLDGSSYFKIYNSKTGEQVYENILKEGEYIYTTPSEDDYKELQRINDELEKKVIERIVKIIKENEDD